MLDKVRELLHWKYQPLRPPRYPRGHDNPRGEAEARIEYLEGMLARAVYVLLEAVEPSEVDAARTTLAELKGEE